MAHCKKYISYYTLYLYLLCNNFVLMPIIYV